MGDGHLLSVVHARAGGEAAHAGGRPRVHAGAGGCRRVLSGAEPVQSRCSGVQIHAEGMQAGAGAASAGSFRPGVPRMFFTFSGFVPGDQPPFF